MTSVIKLDVLRGQIARSRRLLEHYRDGRVSRDFAIEELMLRFGHGLADATVILNEVDVHGVPE